MRHTVIASACLSLSSRRCWSFARRSSYNRAPIQVNGTNTHRITKKQQHRKTTVHAPIQLIHQKAHECDQARHTVMASARLSLSSRSCWSFARRSSCNRAWSSRAARYSQMRPICCQFLIADTIAYCRDRRGKRKHCNSAWSSRVM